MASFGEDASPEFDINAEARAHAGYLGLSLNAGESDVAFRSRIAGILRSRGSIIEAHEVSSGRRYDDPEQGSMGPMVGIIGAVAQALAGHEYSPNDPERQVGDDIAAGLITRNPDRTAESIGAILSMFGPTVGMDVIDAFRDKR